MEVVEMIANTDKTNKAVERLAETTRDSYQTVVEHTIGLGERNVRFAQGVVDSSVKEVRQQAESNRALTQEFVERAENQRAAFQTVVEESVDAYLDFVFAPLSYYKEGLQAAKKATR
jgi:methyl-accepting chemotaxis protein